MRPMGNSKPFVLVIVVVPFLGTVLAICSLWQRAVHWPDLVLLGTLYTLTGVGVGIGFHRMLTHRSFQAHPVVRGIVLILGVSAAFLVPYLFHNKKFEEHVV